MTQQTATPLTNSDEIDLRDLVMSIWAQRRWIALSSVACLLLAAIYAYGIAKPVFESSALLIPVQSQSPDQLGAAVALLGKKPTSSGDVDLYQSLLTSRTVIQKLLIAPIRNLSDTGQGRIEPLYAILGVDMQDPVLRHAVLKGLSGSIVVIASATGAGGLIEVRFEANSPWLAQQIGEQLLTIGQEELRLVRTRRSDMIVSRLSVAVAQAKTELDKAASEVTLFQQINRSQALPEQQLELSNLEMEKDAKKQKYLMARKEYELQLLEKEKATPPMMILDPADLPVQKIRPKRVRIVAGGMLLGAALGIIGALLLKAFRANWKEK